MADAGPGDERHRLFAAGLAREERVLLLVRDELYCGSWAELEADLHARRERKPAIFKLNTRIDEDLGRISTLRAYEREHGVDLRRLLELVAGPEGLERTP
ncbi:MAG: hypothetical protein KIT58_10145 [Planctomycetota bacterium]|nr:hypothetical protein [Planctomycetota bacterium]